MPDPITPKESLDGARQQFKEQIEFFKRKVRVPTETWRDIERNAHDRAFMVAGAMKADLLKDLQQAVKTSVEGGSIGEFRKQFKSIVQKHGWTGWTGEGTKAGEAWRTRVIYQTNLATSYAAGRRKQLLDPALLSRRPFWRYVHDDSVTTPRPHHKAWGDSGLTLRHDHPFWSTHFPPNGWGCKCRVVAVKAPAEGDATEPPDGWLATDPKTGAPAGIDEGWDYAPGALADQDLRCFVQNKVVTQEPVIAEFFKADVGRYLNQSGNASAFVRAVEADKSRKDDLWLGFIPDAKSVEKVTGVNVSDYLLTLPADSARHVDKRHGKDKGDQRPPAPDDYNHLIDMLLSPDDLALSKDTGKNGEQRLSVSKSVRGGRLEAVFELRHGKRILALQTLWVKVTQK